MIDRSFQCTCSKDNLLGLIDRERKFKWHFVFRQFDHSYLTNDSSSSGLLIDLTNNRFDREINHIEKRFDQSNIHFCLSHISYSQEQHGLIRTWWRTRFSFCLSRVVSTRIASLSMHSTRWNMFPCQFCHWIEWWF